jgi:hypothetical protein
MFSLMALPVIFFPTIIQLSIGNSLLQQFSAESEKYQTVRFSESFPLKENLKSKHCVFTMNIKFENINISIMKPDCYNKNTQDFSSYIKL